MNSFINNLLDRHIDTAQNVKPLMRGQFNGPADFPEEITGDHESVLEKEEIPQTTSFSPREWKNKMKPVISEKGIEENAEPAIKKDNSRSHVIATSIEKKNKEEQQDQPAKTSAVPLQQVKKAANENLLQPVTQQESIIRRLQRRYQQKSYLVKAVDEENQVYQNDETGELNNKPGSVLQNNSFAEIEANKNEFEKEQLAVYPLIIKGKWNQQIPASSGNTAATQVINVSIGRIEIKASLPAADTKPATKKEKTGVLGLEQYLEQAKSSKQ
jgi:hypothetical protein